MRKVLLPAALLGVVAGAVFIHRDALRLTVAWPVVLGFALWEASGERGSRGIIAALTAGGGVAAGYLTFFIVSEFLPLTDLWLGLTSGLAIAVMVAIALLSRGWISVSPPLIGFAAFFGVFEPIWRQSAGNFRSHGLDAGSTVGLGLVVGALAAAVARWITDGVRARAAERHPSEATEEQPSATVTELLEGGAHS